MRTLVLMAAKVVCRLAMLALLLSPLALPARAEAIPITLGEMHLTGSFTLNPAYNFNQPTAQPFGGFADLTVTHASGIFAPFVASGDVLVMNTPFVLSPPSTALSSTKPLAGQMLWSIGGYTIDTTWDVITGADFVGRHVLGLMDLSFHGFDFHNADPALNGLGPFGYWNFTAPPYDITNFTSPVTGPIELTIFEKFEDGRAPVPEPSPLLLLGLGLVGLTAWQWKATKVTYRPYKRGDGSQECRRSSRSIGLYRRGHLPIGGVARRQHASRAREIAANRFAKSVDSR